MTTTSEGGSLAERIAEALGTGARIVVEQAATPSARARVDWNPSGPGHYGRFEVNHDGSVSVELHRLAPEHAIEVAHLLGHP